MPRRSNLAGAVAVLAALGGGAAQAGAQAAPDFLFRTPTVSLGLRGGYAVARATGEIFDFTRERLTVERSDFNAPAFGGQLAVRIAPRVDVAVDVSVAQTRSRSEFRDWVDTDDLPIEQETEFQRVPLTFGVKAYLKDRGRQVGRFAWVPAQWAPYVGAGAGWVWYRFRQDGDFVDFETLDIFKDNFTSSGRAPTLHLYGGADWSLGPNFFLTGEARYAWASAEMGGDFVDFDPVNLSGLQATVGLSVRF
jgi:hypothetical protein